MQIDRRTMMAGGAAAIAGRRRRWREQAARGSIWYDRAIVIDALGGIGDPYGAGGVSCG